MYAKRRTARPSDIPRIVKMTMGYGASLDMLMRWSLKINRRRLRVHYKELKRVKKIGTA